MAEPQDSPEPVGALASLVPQVRPVRLRGAWAVRLLLLVVSLPFAVTILSIGISVALEDDHFVHGVVVRVLQHRHTGTCEAVVRHAVPSLTADVAARSSVVVEAVDCDALPAVGDTRTVQVVERSGRTVAHTANVVGAVIVACFVAGAAVVFVVDLWLLRSVTVLTLRSRRLARSGVDARAVLVSARSVGGVTRAVYRYDVSGHGVDTVAWSLTQRELLPREVDVLHDAIYVDQCMLASDGLVRRTHETPTPTMNPEVLL